MDTGLDRPILITGRGGSGTRLAADMAMGVGVFLGNELNKSSDSLEYEDAVKGLMREKLASGPLATQQLATWRKTFRGLARDVLAVRPWPADQPWGWKLPELVFELPEVCSFFSDARVIHLVRHPVDSSLRRSHMTSRMNNPVGKMALPTAYQEVGLDPERARHDERHMRNAVSWEYQVGTVARWAREALPAERYLEIHYEDMYARPAEVQQQMATFTGGDATGATVPEFDPARMRTYEPGDPLIDEVWAVCASTAEMLGYERPVSS